MNASNRLPLVLRVACVLILVAPTLSGCQLRARAAENTQTHEIRVDELERRYFLHVPPGLPADKAVPLVLMFHGGGGRPAFAERESRFSELADREGFLVAYPEGIGQSWNDGRGDLGLAAQRDNVDDVAFVAALLDDVAGRHEVDPRRVFATGMSNGAIFSHTLAARLSTRIAAIAPVTGGIAQAFSESFAPEQPVSVLILQSTADPLVPYDGGPIRKRGGAERAGILSTAETVRKWVEHNGAKAKAVVAELPDTDPQDGCRVQTFTHSGGRKGSSVVLYRIEGGGHTWPGGLQYLPERFIGKVCRDISATEVIWNFFKAHGRP